MKKEVGTLRTIMRGYLHQIDSLNTLNKKLIDEKRILPQGDHHGPDACRDGRREGPGAQQQSTPGIGYHARGIRMVALNARSKEVSRIKNAERLRVDFTLTANALATPGEKTIYVRILSPDGYVLSSESVPTFESRANASLTPHRVTWITRTKTSTSVSSTPAAASPPVPTRYRSIATGS